LGDCHLSGFKQLGFVWYLDGVGDHWPALCS
jgi:hypothetical protein